MGVRIVIDSTTNIAENLKDKFTIVPLTIRFGETEYIDGVTIDNQQFYEKLIESDVLPQTSQATPDAFEKVFREAVDQGDDVVALIVSSKLSGTYQSACIAAEDFEGKVFVVDTKSVAIGAGILAEFCLQQKDQGMNAAQIARIATNAREQIRVIALLDTLEYLKKGGRISGTVAFAGGLLSIKPVVSLNDGSVSILGKARGSKQGNNLLVKEIEACGGVDFTKPVLLGYTGLTDIYLKKYIEDSKFLWQDYLDHLRTTVVGSVVGTHAGPGVVAAAFFKKEEKNS